MGLESGYGRHSEHKVKRKAFAICDTLYRPSSVAQVCDGSACVPSRAAQVGPVQITDRCRF